MVRWILKTFGGKFLGSLLRGVAEGKYGAGWQKAYTSMIGWKTVTGALLGGFAVVSVSVGWDSAAAVLATVGALGVTGGLLDKTWRTRPSWDNVPLWVLARDHGADIVAALGMAAAYFTSCTPETAAFLGRVHMTCGQGVLAVTALTALAAWLFPEAMTAEPPKVEGR